MSARTEPLAVRIVLISVALAFLLLFLVAPLALVFAQALADGAGAWVTAVTDPVARAAVKLTLLTVAIVVPVNVVFGVAAAWAIAHSAVSAAVTHGSFDTQRTPRPGMTKTSQTDANRASAAAPVSTPASTG